MRRWFVIAMLVVAVPAHGDSPPDRDRAAKLFEQGRELATKGDYQRAYDTFKTSYELDRAVGTELNLADCLEHLDQPAKAIELYEDAEKQLTASGKGPQAKFAHERVTALARKLGIVVVKLDPVVAGTVVTIANQPVDAAPEIRRRLPPGPVEVAIAVPARPPMRRTITLAASGEEMVTLPATETPMADVTSERRDPKRVWLAIGVGGVGVATLVASAVTVLVARSDYNSTQNNASLCMGGRCNPEGLDRIAHAQRLADLSTGLFVGGLVIAAVGGVLWYTAPHEHAMAIAPLASPTSAGVSVVGAF